MKETSKAMRRRKREGVIEEKPDGLSPFFWDKIFQGHGLDVGSGDDPLVLSNGHVRCLDLPDGSGDDVTKFIGDGRKFDFVHGSQVLEHALDPAVMLRSWLKVLKPGGYIVATVPDFVTYEGEVWPSKWNAGHQTAWTIYGGISMKAILANVPIRLLPEWLDQFDTEVKLCRLIDTSDHSIGQDADQTIPPDGAEVSIEFVLRKKL